MITGVKCREMNDVADGESKSTMGGREGIIFLKESDETLVPPCLEMLSTKQNLALGAWIHPDSSTQLLKESLLCSRDLGIMLLGNISGCG